MKTNSMSKVGVILGKEHISEEFNLEGWMKAISKHPERIPGKTTSAGEMFFGKTYMVKGEFKDVHGKVLPLGTLVQPIKKRLAYELYSDLIIPNDCKPALVTDAEYKTSHVIVYRIADKEKSVIGIDNIYKTRSNEFANLKVTELYDIPLAYLIMSIVVGCEPGEYLAVKLNSKLELSISNLNNNVSSIRNETRVLFPANETIKLLSEWNKTTISKQTLIHSYNKYK